MDEGHLRGQIAFDMKVMEWIEGTEGLQALRAAILAVPDPVGPSSFEEGMRHRKKLLLDHFRNKRGEPPQG